MSLFFNMLSRLVIAFVPRSKRPLVSWLQSPSAVIWELKKIKSATVSPSICHVWIWELDYKESWVQKKWCFWTVVLEKTLESPLDCKEIKPVYPKGNQPWIFIGRTYAEAETPVLWPPDAKKWLIGKHPDAGKRLKAGGEGDNRGWDGWMASLTWWTWVWASSGSWQWTGRPGMPQSTGSQTVWHKRANELWSNRN